MPIYISVPNRVFCFAVLVGKLEHRTLPMWLSNCAGALSRSGFIQGNMKKNLLTLSLLQTEEWPPFLCKEESEVLSYQLLLP